MINCYFAGVIHCSFVFAQIYFVLLDPIMVLLSFDMYSLLIQVLEVIYSNIVSFVNVTLGQNSRTRIVCGRWH